MRLLRILAAIMILAGVALLIYSVAVGKMQVALVLFVPVIFGSSIEGILAIGLIIAGVFVAIADPFMRTEGKSPQERLPNEGSPTETSKGKEFGGAVLIGPIPIVFGSSKRMTLFIAVLAAIVLVIMILSFFFIRG
jgi:uncharacterized protein (TIGR00304 family)